MVIDGRQPLVSVLLPVYNGARYIDEAIESILSQTYTNFELIIINDGSMDESEEVILRHQDSRIRYISQENKGLAMTLNIGISLASGDYIARQDQDDVSLPQRFSTQITFLETHPAYAMVGTWAEIFSQNSVTPRYHRHPTDPSAIWLGLLTNCPFVHSSMMIRRTSIETIGGYSTDRNRQPPEDYELWSRMAKRYPVGNIPQVLVRYREVAGSMSRDRANPFEEKVYQISRENISYVLGSHDDDPATAVLVDLLHTRDIEERNLPSQSVLRRQAWKLVYFCKSKQDSKAFPSWRAFALLYSSLMVGYWRAKGIPLVVFIFKGMRKIIRLVFRP